VSLYLSTSELPLALEYVEGETLADRIRRGGGPGLPQEEVLRIARQIAEGLGEAHRGGILHRDRKPGNVMITTKGAAKLLDFGLARPVAADADVTQTLHGLVVGTAAYRSLERVPSIAVLPFANMSGDKENEYFSDGLAEEIINVLANVPGYGIRCSSRS
jgi:serine/threonine protein kinase